MCKDRPLDVIMESASPLKPTYMSNRLVFHAGEAFVTVWHVFAETCGFTLQSVSGMTAFAFGLANCLSPPNVLPRASNAVVDRAASNTAGSQDDGAPVQWPARDKACSSCSYK